MPDEVVVLRLIGAAVQGGVPSPVPQGLSATTTATSAVLKWSPSAGAAGYFAWRLGRFLGHTTQPRFSDDGLAPALEYTYEVAAHDAAGNISARARLLVATANELPDLVVTALSWQPEAPKPGDKVCFRATLKNVGNAPARGTLGVAFHVDGRNVAWCTTDEPLSPGQSRTMVAAGGPKGQAHWSMTPGRHTVQAIADDVDRIAESKEDNNALAGVIYRP